jgi:GNAT superfamily N-acetyltransferase
MFKIAGELTPAVIHVAARTIATHALSIFGDHSDVMHARTTGWAMLAAGSVQEAHDFALIAHAATLRARIPFLHFFDGFRTSHEINKIAVLDESDVRALVRDEDVVAFRTRGLTPDAPVVRGTAQNPDVFFQAREACNPYHLAVPGIVQEVMDELATRTGRQYGLVDYHGVSDADRVIIVMGSASGAVEETVDTLVAAGEPPDPDEVERLFGVREIPLGEVTEEALLHFNEPEARAVGVPGGGGVARALMDWVLAEARGRGAEELYLSVFTENHRAKSFYARYGFEAIGPYVFMVGNQADEDVLMRAKL